MKKRLFYLTALLFLVLPLRGSPPIGAAVQTWHYDAAKKAVILRVLNTSHKEITAYTLSIIMRYADGPSAPLETTNDFLPLMVSVSENDALRGQHGNGTFAAGTYIDETIPAQKAVSDVTAHVVMVAYADGKADVIEQRAFDHLIARRMGEVMALQKAQGVIKSSSDPSAASAELTRLADFSKAKARMSPPNDPEIYMENTLRRVSRELSSKSLDEMTQEANKEIAVRAPHINLIKEVAQ